LIRFWFLKIRQKPPELTDQRYDGIAMRIRIITDDFTSALDGTACFAERGCHTTVLIRPDSTTHAEVVSLDTDSHDYPRTLGQDTVGRYPRRIFSIDHVLTTP
jgi:hypothetical protein